MAKLKIGLVLDTSLDPPDGVQQYVIGVGEWLRGQGHDVHYLVGETKHRQLPNIQSLAKNMSVRFNGNRTTIPLPTSKKRLQKVLESERFDVLHVQIPHSPFMAHRLVLAASDEAAVIATFHIAAYNNLVWIGNWLLYLLLWRSIRRFDQVLSVSSAAQEFAHETFHVDSEVSPNVINYGLFRKAQPFERYTDKDTLNILFFGRLVPRKGCMTLLRAAARIKDELGTPKFRVIICGKGPQAETIKQFIDRNDLNGVVEMTGFVSEADKPRYYASADISVFPSTGGESFGIVLLEAMASGKAAVLAGDNPGYRSVLEPRPESLFDPSDVHGLADLLKQYLIDKKLRQSAQKWAQSYAKRFDRDTVGKELLKYYDEALRKRRGA